MFPFCPRELCKKGWQAGQEQCLGHCLHCHLHWCRAVTLLCCPPWDSHHLPAFLVSLESLQPLWKVPGSQAVPWAAPSRAQDEEGPTYLKWVVGKAGVPSQCTQRGHLKQAVIKWLSGCYGCQPMGAWLWAPVRFPPWAGSMVLQSAEAQHSLRGLELLHSPLSFRAATTLIQAIQCLLLQGKVRKIHVPSFNCMGTIPDPSYIPICPDAGQSKLYSPSLARRCSLWHVFHTHHPASPSHDWAVLLCLWFPVSDGLLIQMILIGLHFQLFFSSSGRIK